ncbi:MAG TPA: uracil-DNA glycosylase [Bacillota bacterium]|nr:uracil-DNA glycosylase [Bacillota bacterium]
MSKQPLTNDWGPLLNEQFQLPYFIQLKEFLRKEYATKTIYPPKKDMLNALYSTPFHHVKVVILGQDPYHGPHQAHGLSFSVQKGVSQPPSLKNIFKELVSDLGCEIPSHGNLTAWASQGVLLLNTTLTVENGKAYSHQGKGWEIFTDEIIRKLNDKQQPIVYLLWGKAAEQKGKLIDTKKHFTISSPHPSPLSAYRGFFGSKPFSRANELLIQTGQEPVDWNVPDE